jgi:hypothetical protein
MRQILNIRQTRIIVEYIEKFDDLRHHILLHDPSASDVFFVTRFIEGLKDDIRSVIAIHRPIGMDTVSSLAMMQEEENETVKRKGSAKNESSSRYSWKSSVVVDKAKEAKKPDDIGKFDDKMGSLLAYKKSKGLCYKCGDKWGKGHSCPAQVPLHVLDEVFSAMRVKYPNTDSDSDDGFELMDVKEIVDPQ